jgi:hypothetical protein
VCLAGTRPGPKQGPPNPYLQRCHLLSKQTPLLLPPAGLFATRMSFSEKKWAGEEKIIIAIDCGTTQSSSPSAALENVDCL